MFAPPHPSPHNDGGAIPVVARRGASTKPGPVRFLHAPGPAQSHVRALALCFSCATMRSRDRAGEQESDDRRTTLREASCAQQQELRQQGKQDTNRSFMLSAVLLDMSANASFCFSRPSLTFSLFSRHLSVRAARAACQSTARMSGHAPCEQPSPSARIATKFKRTPCGPPRPWRASPRWPGSRGSSSARAARGASARASWRPGRVI